jgi:hypothetical protein
MTKEERQLLLVDLSARFPYNVAIDCRSENSRFTCYLTSDMLREIQNNNCYWEYKPFLFPLSSMTEEQKEELKMICDWHDDEEDAQSVLVLYHKHFVMKSDVIDWLNKNHFDWRGLIPKGLANDTTGLNIY